MGHLLGRLGRLGLLKPAFVAAASPTQLIPYTVYPTTRHWSSHVCEGAAAGKHCKRSVLMWGCVKGLVMFGTLVDIKIAGIAVHLDSSPHTENPSRALNLGACECVTNSQDQWAEPFGSLLVQCWIRVKNKAPFSGVLKHLVWQVAWPNDHVVVPSQMVKNLNDVGDHPISSISVGIFLPFWPKSPD